MTVVPTRAALPDRAAPAIWSRRRTILLITVTCGASALIMGDVIAATLILPIMGRTLIGAGASTADLQWVVGAAMIPYAALLTTCGQLADALGRARMLVAGLILFTAAALAATAAPTLPLLLAARALQGAAAAAIIPASLGLLLAHITLTRRAAAIGAWSAAAGLGGVFMHSTGGWLADQLGWRALLAPSVLISLALVCAALALPSAPSATGPLPDLLGSTLLLAGIAALVMAVSKGQHWGWRAPLTIGCIGGGAALVMAALWRSARHARPALDLQLWRQPTFALGGSISLLYGAVSFTLLALAPLLLHQVWGIGIAFVGLAIAPISAGVVVTALLAGRVIRRHGPRPVTYAGVLVAGAATLWVLAAAMSDQPRLQVWIPASALIGCGLGAISTGASAAAALSAGAHRYASAVGASMTARQVGGALGVAAATAILQQPPLTGPLPGYSAVIVALIVLTAVTGVLALFIAPPAPSTTGASTPSPSLVTATPDLSPLLTAAAPFQQQHLPRPDLYAIAGALVNATGVLLAHHRTGTLAAHPPLHRGGHPTGLPTPGSADTAR
ncbi:MFS transporter [Streptosporangium sp. CA-115845]|uniref:MFS transporter n=1 Tax=Streptosporangium sp. CA-115845 TaxID=3240071 RepID=UPI003D8DAB7F